MKKLGVIGCGNMGGAMLSRLLSAGVLAPGDVVAADKSEKMLEDVRTLGVEASPDNTEAAGAEIVLLSVKPQFYPQVISQIAPVLAPETLLLTIAPGFAMERVERLVGRPVPIVRAMPNTPALVGAGMTAACHNGLVDQERFEYVLSLLGCLGPAEEVPERLMEAVVGVSGSSPAYVFMFIEALSDAGVRAGMPRPQALRFAAQAVLGSAKLMLDTGKHPGQLKDMVCSPAGTTIEAVATLEKLGFRGAVMEAVKDCIDKCHELAK